MTTDPNMFHHDGPSAIALFIHLGAAQPLAAAVVVLAVTAAGLAWPRLRRARHHG